MLGDGIDVAAQYGVSYPSTDYYGVAITSAAKIIGAGQAINWTSGTGTCSQATSFLGRTSTPPNATQQQYNALICGGVADGWWAQADAIYKWATDSATDANLNLVANKFNVTTGGTETFTANQGYQGDGLTGFLNSNFTPSTAAGNATLNSTAIIAYVTNNRTTPITYSAFGVFDATADAYSNLAPNQAGGTTNSAISEIGAGFSAGVVTAQGFYVVSRTASSLTTTYRNTASLGTTTDASVALNTIPLYFGAFDNAGSAAPGTTFGPSADMLAYGGILSGLTATQQLFLSYRINADAIALGINTW